MSDTKDLQAITDLRQDPDNANLGTERGLYILDDSLTECGAGRSVLVDNQGTLIAGNKTVERAADKDFPIRVVKTDGTELVVVQRTDLDLGGEGDEQRRARRLALFDNRSSEVGLEWIAEQILALAETDDDLLDGLFNDDELTELLAGLVEEDTPTLDELADEYGNPEERDFWPYVKVQVSPETYELYLSLMSQTGTDDEANGFRLLVEAVDASILGPIVS